jgi:hypothetical protein
LLHYEMDVFDKVEQTTVPEQFSFLLFSVTAAGVWPLHLIHAKLYDIFSISCTVEI